MKRLLTLFLIPMLLFAQAKNTITNDGTKATNWYIGITPNAKAGIGIDQSKPLFNTLTVPNSGTIGSETFSPGWLGGGWKLDYINSEHTLTIDNLDVRGVFTAREFIINQLQVQNGNLLVSSSGKVDTVITSTYPPYFIVENATNHGVAPFTTNDLIQCQVVDPNGTTFDANGNVASTKFLMKRLIYRVTGVVGLKVYYTSIFDGPSNVGVIEKGDLFVRIGNTTNTTRQGMVGIYADEQYSPFIKITNSIDSWTASKNINNLKVQLGRLHLTTATFGAIDTYGLYAQGSIYLENGSIALSNSGYIYGGKSTYASTADGWYLGNDVGTPKLNIGDATRYIKWNGDSLLIKGNVLLDNQSSIAISGFNNDAGFITSASAGNRTYYRYSAPPTPIIGDFWFHKVFVSPDSVYRMDRYNGSFWDNVSVYMDGTGLYAGSITAGQITTGTINIARINQADINTSSITNGAGFVTPSAVTHTFAQTSAPTALATGDVWIDTDDNNTMYRWNGTSWVEFLGVGSGIGTYIDGTGIYTGSITAGQVTAGTLTGFTIQTAASGARIVMDNTNYIKFYADSSGSYPLAGKITSDFSVTSTRLLAIANQFTHSGAVDILGNLYVGGTATIGVYSILTTNTGLTPSSTATMSGTLTYSAEQRTTGRLYNAPTGSGSINVAGYNVLVLNPNNSGYTITLSGMSNGQDLYVYNYSSYSITVGESLGNVYFIDLKEGRMFHQDTTYGMSATR